jgi:hypothetical protein
MLVEADQRSIMTAGYGSSATGEMLMLTTAVTSFARTDQQGRFELLIGKPGRYDTTVGGFGSQRGERVAIDVTESRDDVVIPVRTGATLTVRVRSASTGEILPGSYVGMRSGKGSNASSVGEDGTVSFESVPTNHPFTLLVAKTGYAMAQENDVQLEPGRPATIEIRLGRGGELRVLAPAGAVKRDPMAGWFSGTLRLVGDHGTDYAIPMGTRAEAEEVAPGEWVFPHLPEGPLRAYLGDTKSVQVEIQEGVPAVADLR